MPRMIPEKCDAVFPRDKRGTRLRGDHAQIKNWSAFIALRVEQGDL
jgi:hypothetical protein